MASNLLDPLNTHFTGVRDRIISIICQTLIYGIYLCLIPIAVHVMVTKGLQSRQRKWLLAIITSMFALSTVYWIASIVLTFVLVDSWNSSVRACYGRVNASVCIARMMAAPRRPRLPIFDDILLVNYIVADGIIVWRAWVLCFDQSRVVLMTPVVMLAINTVVYLMTVAVRAALLATEAEVPIFNLLNRMVKGNQLAHQTLSLLINIYATSIIALKTWKCRKLLMKSGMGVHTPTQTVKILGLLVESGMIYILIGATILASHAILLHFRLGAINDVFMPMGIQLVGIYPIVVVLLVEKNRSLNSEFCSFGAMGDFRGRSSPMCFASEPTSSSQIDQATKSRNIDIRITFDSVSEPGDAGTIRSHKA